MPRKDISNIEKLNVGHNEETFEFFTNLAKYKKRQIQIQGELIRERNINVNDLTAMHQAIKDSEIIAKQEHGL
jgi:hypothetical protein